MISSSTAVKSYTWHKDELKITFSNDRSYVYFSVPEYFYQMLIYLEMHQDKSVGAFVNEYIVNGGFDYSEI